MLWYGYKTIYSPRLVLNEKQKWNKKSKKLNFYLSKSLFINYLTLRIHLPDTYNYLFLTSKLQGNHLVHIYNNTYFFNLNIPSYIENIFLDTNTSAILVATIYTQSFYKMYWKYMLTVFDALNRPFFLKVKFKGKGYYIFKNKRQVITPQFGHAHRLYFYAYFASVKFLSKTSIFLFGLIQTDLIKVGYGIYNMRPINIFTGRGVRFSRQIIYKKTGKVSSYR